MTREEVKQEVLARVKCTDFLEKSKGNMYCCPFCGSGHGTNGTGALKYYPQTNTVCCFAESDGKNTGKRYDVIDLFQHATGADYNTALVTLAEQIGVYIDPYTPNKEKSAHKATERPQTGFNSNGDKIPAEKGKGQNGANMSAESVKDYSAFYRECSQRIEEPAAAEYLKKRGISIETARAYSIGYCESWKSPAALERGYTPLASARIIIPISKNHYIARATDPEIKDFAKMNETGHGGAGIFNISALYSGMESVFITEGAFDALSIIEAGGTAIALNSTSNAGKLIEQLEERATDSVIILSLDNDKGGEKARETLESGLQRLNIAYSLAAICGSYKDPNEHLQADREAFIKAVKAAEAGANVKKPDNTAAYIEIALQGDIERLKAAADKKTGFEQLDKKSGGLYAGLYVLAAISSLGKTTFALQIADNLAAAGHDVLFFSLEQSRLELISKSFARILEQRKRDRAATSLQLRKGENAEQLAFAAAAYKEKIGDRMSIIEGNFNCNISFIGSYIRNYIARTGKTPIVFIDYLQILQPAEEQQKKGTKEQIDHTITELKRISRELDITLFVISSVNRANYLVPIDFTSLKESGGIEYTADVILGLQLACIETDPIFSENEKIKKKRETIKQAKERNPREVELVCLKNRYGVSSFSCFYNYYPAHDLFIESSNAAQDFRGIDTEPPFEGKEKDGSGTGTQYHF